MSRPSLVPPLAACLLALGLPLIVPRTAHAQSVTVRNMVAAPDSLAIDAALARARRQATDGDLTGARVVLDSLATVGEPGSARLAEVLFWRATYAQTAAGAERDYRRLVVEHPMSPRAEDALMRLAQLELARGDQQLAVRHLERLVLEHPESPNRARARYWTARAWMDAGEVTKGCTALGEALTSAAGTDAELRNQVRYAGQRCPKGWDVAVATAAMPTTPPPAAVIATQLVPTAVPTAVPQTTMPPTVTQTTVPPRSAPSGGAPPNTTIGSVPRGSVTMAPPVVANARVDSASRGAPPNTNIAPPRQAAVTTSAPAASPTRPTVIVPPLGRPPVTAPASGGAGVVANVPARPVPRPGASVATSAPVSAPVSVPVAAPVSKPTSVPASAPPVSAPPASAPPVSKPVTVPAVPVVSAPVTMPARNSAGAAGPRRTIYSVQLAAYDTRADAESRARRARLG